MAVAWWNFYGGRISYLKFINDDYYHRYSFGMQTLKLAGLALWPFGKEVRSGSRSGGCLYILMNVIWIFVGGFGFVCHICFWGGVVHNYYWYSFWFTAL